MNVSPATTTTRRLRASRRDYERQLSSYVSPSDVSDMLAALRHHVGPDADLMREVLFAKVAPAA